VRGFQFYEIYDHAGQLKSKFFLDVEFYVHERDSLESLAQGAGLEVETWYGNYDRAAYSQTASPVIIGILKSKR
jgi:hypothetical protein